MGVSVLITKSANIKHYDMKLLFQVAALAACLASALGQKLSLVDKKVACCAEKNAWCGLNKVTKKMIKACQDGVQQGDTLLQHMNPYKKKNCQPLKSKECKGKVKPVKKERNGVTASYGLMDYDPEKAVPTESPVVVPTNPWDFDGAEIKGFRVSCQSDVYESGDTYLAALVTDVGNCKQNNRNCRSMLNGYLIIFNKSESKNFNQLASRYFGNQVQKLKQLRNRPYNMKFTTFNWKGDDRTFRKGNTKTGITNFKSNDGRRTQPSAFELAAFYPLMDAWRKQVPYYNKRVRKNKIRGKTVMLNEVEQTAKHDLDYLQKTDLFLNAQDANQFISYLSPNSVTYENNGSIEYDSNTNYESNGNYNNNQNSNNYENSYYDNNNNNNQDNNNNKNYGYYYNN